MRLYAVYESRDPKADGQDVVLVREGFCWPALLFAPLWVLWHRMWLVAVVVWAASLALAFLPQWVGGSDVLSSLGSLTLMAIMGFEGNNLRGWSLTLTAYDLPSVVGGRNLVEAEQRFFTAMGPAFYSV